MAVAATQLLAAARAHGDDLASPRGQDLAEIRHDVVIERVSNEARFEVTRVIKNEGEQVTEVELEVDLPPRSVVHSFRHRLDGAWGKAKLVEVEVASESFWLRGTPIAQRRRGPAVMSWSGVGSATAEVYPLAPGAEVTLVYSMRAPLCYVDGRYFTAYPNTAVTPLRTPQAKVKRGLAVSPGLLEQAHGTDGFDSCGISLDGNQTVIEFEDKNRIGIKARYARYPFSDGEILAGFELYVGQVLEPTPVGASVLFVIDGSYSAGTIAIRKQLELAAKLLALYPKGRGQVVIYRRDADVLFERPLTAAEFSAALVAIPAPRLAAGNGSHLDRGLTSAASLASGIKGPVRIYAMTDGQWRNGFGAERAFAALAELSKKVVVHVVEFDGGDGDLSWSEDTTAVLAEVTAQWGGMTVLFSGIMGDIKAATATVLEGLVRPTEITDLALDLGGAEFEGFDVADVLAEGEGLSAFGIGTEFPPVAVLTGRIWGRQVSYTLKPDVGFSSSLPAIVFGQDAITDRLGEGAVFALAKIGGVISPQTSFLSLIPGPRPGDVEDGMGMLSGACSCSGTFSTSSVGHIGTAGTREGKFDPLDRRAIAEQLLWPRVSACALSHRPGPADLQISLEVTGHEIVDVSSPTTGKLATFAACVIDAAWSLELDARFNRGHQTYQLRYLWGTGADRSAVTR